MIKVLIISTDLSENSTALRIRYLVLYFDFSKLFKACATAARFFFLNLYFVEVQMFYRSADADRIVR